MRGRASYRSGLSFVLRFEKTGKTFKERVRLPVEE
jgi:hypothetical protein